MGKKRTEVTREMPRKAAKKIMEEKVSVKRILQWHPAFCAGMQIDLLIIKKQGSRRIRKNIGRIFRGHNIMEYKSPTDTLSVDDFYRVYGYACCYKSDVRNSESIGIEDLTITFACHRYPEKLFRHLKEKRKFSIQKMEEAYRFKFFY